MGKNKENKENKEQERKQRTCTAFRRPRGINISPSIVSNRLEPEIDNFKEGRHSRCQAHIDLGPVGWYFDGMVVIIRITQGVTDYATCIALRTIRSK